MSAINPLAPWGYNQTLEQSIAQSLYEACVGDHAERPWTERPIAEQRAFIKQARAAIDCINRGPRR